MSSHWRPYGAVVVFSADAFAAAILAVLHAHSLTPVVFPIALVMTGLAISMFIELVVLYVRASRENARLLEEQVASQTRETTVMRTIQTAADGFVQLSSESMVMTWDESASELFGWNEHDVLGREFVTRVVVPEHAETMMLLFDEVWSAADRNQGYRTEFKGRNRNGIDIDVEATIWIDETSRFPHLNMFLRDISSRKQEEARINDALTNEREAVTRLQQLDQAKTDFVSSVSHELRSPLTSTLGYLELLAEGDAGALEPEQSRMVEIAARNAKRLQELIEDLLTLSRIEAGAFNIRFRPVDIKTVIQKVVENCAIAAGERNIELNLSIGDNIGTCPGEEVQLGKAIHNLVDNAVKFTPSNGTVNVNVTGHENEVVIIVSDTGIGIPVDEQPQLFQRFFRASVAIEKAHHGTGLGLTIARAILEHHGGSIKIESVLAEGTTATVSLPAMPVTAEVSPSVELA